MNSQNTVPCGPVPCPTQEPSTGSIRSALPHRGPSNSCKARVFLAAMLGFVYVVSGSNIRPRYLMTDLTFSKKDPNNPEGNHVRVAFRLMANKLPHPDNTQVGEYAYIADNPLVDAEGNRQWLQIVRVTDGWLLRNTNMLKFATMKTETEFPLTGTAGTRQWEPNENKISRLFGNCIITTVPLFTPDEYNTRCRTQMDGVEAIYKLCGGDDFYQRLQGAVPKYRIERHEWRRRSGTYSGCTTPYQPMVSYNFVNRPYQATNNLMYGYTDLRHYL